jgi:peptide-methionine (R)-S-oxide reductase
MTEVKEYNESMSKVDMTEDAWKKKLTPEQYHILREKGTEAPGTGALLHNDKAGNYVCAACGNVVFSSDTKFDSGSGWPSFYDVANAKSVVLTEDNSLGMHRTEVTCANCGSHLGHLFNDAYDQPTGQRFCINSEALDFSEKS